MLARRLTTILPSMPLAEAIETTRIHRVAGRPGDHTALITTHPFRAPYHTLSEVRLSGRGVDLMARRGVEGTARPPGARSRSSVQAPCT
jgi:predicted ATPase with chaperone activity